MSARPGQPARHNLATAVIWPAARLPAAFRRPSHDAAAENRQRRVQPEVRADRERQRSDAEQFDGSFYGRLGAQVKFNQTWGITGDVKFLEGDTQYFIGPRASL